MEFLNKDAVGPIVRTRRQSKVALSPNLDRPVVLPTPSSNLISEEAQNDKAAENFLNRQNQLNNGNGGADTAPSLSPQETRRNLPAGPPGAEFPRFQELTKRDPIQNWKTLRNHKIIFQFGPSSAGASSEGLSSWFSGQSKSNSAAGSASRHWWDYYYITDGLVWVLDNGIFLDYNTSPLYQSATKDEAKSIANNFTSLFRATSNEIQNLSTSPSQKTGWFGKVFRGGARESPSNAHTNIPTNQYGYAEEQQFPKYVYNQPSAGVFIPKSAVKTVTKDTKEEKQKLVIFIDVANVSSPDPLFKNSVPGRVGIEFDESLYSQEGTTFVRLIGPWAYAPEQR